MLLLPIVIVIFFNLRPGSCFMAKVYILNHGPFWKTRGNHIQFSERVYPQLENGLAFFYLQNELKLSSKSLTNIILNYSWIMYLKVDTNLRPTVEVFESFGFKKRHIRKLVEQVPSVLAINKDWTLPEKLISLEKMFCLHNPRHLVKVVTAQPLLLTSSVERNLAVANFLGETMGLEAEDIKAMLLKHPQVAMVGVGVLTACWSVLTEVYGFTEREASGLILKHPELLSRAMLNDGSTRVELLRRELGVIPPFREAQKLVLRYPALLFLDVSFFLQPNIDVLKKHMKISSEHMIDMLQICPQLLGFHPITLERRILTLLWILTGEKNYIDDMPEPKVPRRGMVSEEVEEVESEDIVIVVDPEEDAALRYSPSPSFSYIYSSEDDIDYDYDYVNVSSGSGAVRGVDLLAPLQHDHDLVPHSSVYVSGSASTDGEGEDRYRDRDLASSSDKGSRNLLLLPLPTHSTTRHHNNVNSHVYSYSNSNGIKDIRGRAAVHLSEVEAVRLIRRVPSVISFRSERSLSVLATVAITLDLTTDELTRCLISYPRLLSFSVDGKLVQFFQELATLAIECEKQRQRHIQTHRSTQRHMLTEIHTEVSDDKVKDSSSGSGSGSLSVAAVRGMLRSVILRFPPLLGYSVDRLMQRGRDMLSLGGGLEWEEIVNVVRRPEDAHLRWMDKIKDKHMFLQKTDVDVDDVDDNDVDVGMD
eukprot:gene3857-7692_t